MESTVIYGINIFSNNVCKWQRLENELGIFPTISILKDKSKLHKLARCPIPSEIAPLSELEQRFIDESQLTFDNHGGMKELKLLEERSRTESNVKLIVEIE
jgi:hypothetical protein